jgi:hypothetical protein
MTFKDRLQSLYQNRLKKGKNTLLIFYADGDRGVGKSYMALRYAEKLDPSFSIDRVVFTVEEFLERVIEFTEADPAKGMPLPRIIVFDDAGVEVDSREYNSRSNLAVRHVAETFRQDLISVFFTVPSLSMIDSSTKEMADAVIKVIDHGLGRAYRFIYDPFNKKWRTPFLFWIGDPDNPELRVKLPSKELIEAYEKKKAKARREWYIRELQKVREERNRGKTRKITVSEIAEKIRKEGIEKYRNAKGKLDAYKISALHGISVQSAYKVIRLLE